MSENAPGGAPGSRAPGSGAQLLADVAGMVRFFSRLPVPALSRADDPAAMPSFARGVRVLPLAALAIAAPAAVVLGLLGATALPPLATAGLALAAGLVATGALHEDGLADTADGFGGGASRERKLEIMKDSRIGSYGAAALGLSLLIRAALIGALLERTGPAGAAAALLAGAAVSRSAAVALMALLPPARADGASRTAGTIPAGAVAAGFALAAVLALGLGLLATGARPALAGVAAAALAVAVVGRIARAQIGGQTGDVIGTGQQAAETAFLAALVAAA